MNRVTVALALGLCLATTSLTQGAQDPVQGPPAPRGEAPPELTDLAAFDRWAQREPRPPLPQRIAALQAYLQGARSQANADRSPARLRLGRLLLEAFEPAPARAQFESVLRDAATAEGSAAPTELRAAATYGLAQALDLDRDRKGALVLLDALSADPKAGRWANPARIAAHHLRHRAPAVGDPLPALSTLGDQHREHALLLVVFAEDHPPSVTRLQALQRVWADAGMPAQDLIAYAVDPRPGGRDQLAAALQLEGPLLTCSDGFLHADLLALGMRGVPSSILVGPDHRVLLRDPPPDRLRTLLLGSR